jgi:hypothetical protein
MAIADAPSMVDAFVRKFIGDIVAAAEGAGIRRHQR